MAKIEFTKPYDKKNTSDTEMRLKITGTQSDAEYEFIISRNTIEAKLLRGVKNPKAHGKSIEMDWFDPRALTEQEKVQLFAAIMDQYRDRSFGDGGFRGASIGVADAKKDGQSRLFIGTNTQRWASPYFKHCAEQNMINAATDTLAFEGAKVSKQNGHNGDLIPAKLKAIYIMQGVNDHTTPMACACGVCTDMLGGGVMDRNAPVVTIPLLTKELKTKVLTDSSSVSVNEQAQSIGEITPPIRSGICTAWKVPISLLNRDRVIEPKLKSDKPEELLKKFIKAASEDIGWAETRGKATIQSLKEWRGNHRKSRKLPETPLAMANALIEQVQAGVKGITKKIQEIVYGYADEANQAVGNIIQSRNSEARLDCTLRDDQSVALDKMNEFLVAKIRDAFADRLRAIPNFEDISPTSKYEWVKKNIKSIRCVAIQLDGKNGMPGTFHYGLQVDSLLDKAMPNAGVVALENAVASLGTHGVRHVWAMEFNPSDILNSRMHTSPKEELERLCKRGSGKDKQDIDFTFIPFNLGNLSHEGVAAISESRQQKEIYPGGYLGSTNEVKKHEKTTSIAAGHSIA